MRSLQSQRLRYSVIVACLSMFAIAGCSSSSDVIVPTAMHESPTETEQVELPELVQKQQTFGNHEYEWYEYIPSNLEGDKPVPLVISIHGASSTGLDQASGTSWHLLAEREGFIVLYPTAYRETFDRESGKKATWDTSAEGNDMAFLEGLIDYAVTTHNIDTSRVYMSGVSMGDLMTSAFARKNGDLLAGVGLNNGPDLEQNIVNQQGELDTPDNAVPVYQNRGSLDRRVGQDWIEGVWHGQGPGIREELNDLNKNFWLETNNNEDLPEIRIDGVHNYQIYSDGTADTLYHEIVDRGHTQPLDTMEVMWTSLFQNFSRDSDGTLSQDGDSMQGDKDAVALVAGADAGYVDNHVVSMDEGAAVEIEETLYVPLDFLTKAFDIEVSYEDGKQSAVLHTEGSEVGLSKNNYLITIDGQFVSLRQPVRYEQGLLYIPVETFAEDVLDKQVSSVIKTEGYEPLHALYISEHNTQLGDDTARTLKYILE